MPSKNKSEVGEDLVGEELTEKERSPLSSANNQESFDTSIERREADTPGDATPFCYTHKDRPTRLSCSRCAKPICARCSFDAVVGQRCRECAGVSTQSARDTTHRRRTPFAGRITQRSGTGGSRTGFVSGAGAGWGSSITPMVKAILIITIAVHVLDFIAPSVYDNIRGRFAMWNAAVEFSEEWWRLFTVVALHGGIMHLLFNMWALWVLGPQVERGSGQFPFLMFYLACAGAGSAVSFQFEDFSFLAVGASGAIFGLFGVWLSWAYRHRKTMQGRDMLSQIGFLLAINLALPFLIPNVAWQAHIGGLVAGILISEVWTRMPREINPVARSLVPLAVILGSILWVLF